MAVSIDVQVKTNECGFKELHCHQSVAAKPPLVGKWQGGQLSFLQFDWWSVLECRNQNP